MHQNTANQGLRDEMKKAGLHQWEVANRLSISEGTLIRWMREELPEEKRAMVQAAIDDLRKEKE